jgi:hypothetical protein
MSGQENEAKYALSRTPFPFPFYSKPTKNALFDELFRMSNRGVVSNFGQTKH